MFVLKLVLMASVFYGTVKAANLAWAMGDIGVGVMAWLNIIGILIIFFMSKPAIKALKDYEEQQARKVPQYTFNPVALGIKGADYWEERYKKKSVKTEPSSDEIPAPAPQQG
jgi:AGCS family alanine or glycine:cation symporter